jgi:hypothetical protein
MFKPTAKTPQITAATQSEWTGRQPTQTKARAKAAYAVQINGTVSPALQAPQETRAQAELEAQNNNLEVQRLIAIENVAREKAGEGGRKA